MGAVASAVECCSSQTGLPATSAVECCSPHATFLPEKTTSQAARTIEIPKDDAFCSCLSQEEALLATERLPFAVVGESVGTMARREGWVRALTFSTNGRYCAAADNDTIQIWMWQEKTHKFVTTLEGHQGCIHSVAFSPDGVLCSGSEDTTVRVWSAEFKSRFPEATLRGHTGWVRTLLFSQNGLLVSGSYDMTVKFWDLTTAQCLRTLSSLGGWVIALAFAPSDEALCMCCGFASIHVWQNGVDNKADLAKLSGHSGKVLALTFSPEGFLCSGSRDSTVKVWSRNFVAGRCLATLVGHTDSVLVLAFAPGGELCSGSKDTSVKIWHEDLKSARCLATVYGHRAPVLAMAFAPSGQLCSGSMDETMRVWDWEEMLAPSPEPGLGSMLQRGASSHEGIWPADEGSSLASQGDPAHELIMPMLTVTPVNARIRRYSC